MWADMVKLYNIDINKPKKKEFITLDMSKTLTPYRRDTGPKIPSLNAQDMSPALKKEPLRYTGTLIKGIATMHKSNAVPVINDQEAKDIAKMRR